MSIIKYEVHVDSDGDTAWHLNGQLHRENGPAVERANGTKRWYLNGQLHREDGPAIECANGTKYWYINGEELTEEEFNNRHIKEMTINEIQSLLGYKIKIIA